MAVNSLDSKVDAVGACVGIRGSRIKNIVDELGGEKIDIVRWNDSSKILIANSLKPAEIAEVSLCFELGRAIVVVTEDQLSLAIGKRGQNVRLAARLTGWDIDILTPNEFNSSLDTLERALREVEGVDSTVVDQMIAMGMVSVVDVEDVGPNPLVKELDLDEALAHKIVARAAEEAKKVAAEASANAQKELEATGDVSPGEGAAAPETAGDEAAAPGQAGQEQDQEAAGAEAAPPDQTGQIQAADQSTDAAPAGADEPTAEQEVPEAATTQGDLADKNNL